MSLIWMDGFDLYTTSSQLKENTNDSVHPAFCSLGNNEAFVKPVTSGGRFGGGRLQMSASAPSGTGRFFVTWDASASSQTTYIQFAIKFTDDGGFLTLLQVFNVNGGTNIFSLAIVGGTLRLNDSTGALIATYSPIPSDEWLYFEIKVSAGPAGQVIIRMNGSDIINDTTGDYDNGQVNPIKIGFLASTGYPYSIDDLVILNTKGSANNSFLGDVIIKTLIPDDNLDTTPYDDWAPRAEANNVDQVVDPVPGGHDSSSTDTRSKVQGEKQTFGMTNLTSPTSPAYINKIHAVQASSVVQNKMLTWNERTDLISPKTSPSIRYIWPSASQTMRGPFAANVPAVANFGGQNWFQIEGSRVENMKDFDGWTVRTGLTRSAGWPDPLGGTGSYKLEHLHTGSSVNDAYLITHNNPLYALPTSFFIKKISLTGSIQVKNPGISPTFGTWTVDLSALTTNWERVDKDHPAVVVNQDFRTNSGGEGGMWLAGLTGGPTDIYAFWPNQTNGTYSTSPVQPISTPVTHSAEEFAFSETDIPIPFYTGSWTVSTYAEHTWTDLSSSNALHYIYWLDTSNYLCLSGSGTETFAKLATTSGSISRSLTYGPSDKVDYSVDFGAGSIAVAGALTGNGTTTGTISIWPAGTYVHIGSSATPDGHFFGLISEPVDDTGDETSLRQLISLNGTEATGLASVPVLESSTGWQLTSDIFESRPGGSSSGSWDLTSVNSLEGGFEHI